MASSSLSWKSLLNGCLGAIRAPTRDKVPGSGMPEQPPNQPVAFSSELHVFTIAELSAATGGFASENLLGAGGLGQVYKGFLEDGVRPGLPAQPVAVKGSCDQDYYAEILLKEAMFLAQLQQWHPCLVKMIGYCWEGEHRLLVYEFMSHGSLEDYLSKRTPSVLPWSTRLSIMLATARALASLHGGNKPLICGDFKASNVMLDSDNNAKLLDLKLFGNFRDHTIVHCDLGCSRFIGSHGCPAPEYMRSGIPTAKSDVYSFGVVLLEVLIAGLKSFDKTRSAEERDLVNYARTFLRDPVKLARIMDPELKRICPVAAAQKAALVTYRCLHVKPKKRPDMSAVVQALEQLITS